MKLKMSDMHKISILQVETIKEVYKSDPRELLLDSGPDYCTSKARKYILNDTISYSEQNIKFNVIIIEDLIKHDYFIDLIKSIYSCIAIRDVQKIDKFSENYLSTRSDVLRKFRRNLDGPFTITQSTSTQNSKYFHRLINCSNDKLWDEVEQILYRYYEYSLQNLELMTANTPPPPQNPSINSYIYINKNDLKPGQSIDDYIKELERNALPPPKK